MIDVEVILRAGEFNGGDQPAVTRVCLLKGSLAGKDLVLPNLHPATALWKPLLNQTALHFLNSIIRRLFLARH